MLKNWKTIVVVYRPWSWSGGTKGPFWALWAAIAHLYLPDMEILAQISNQHSKTFNLMYETSWLSYPTCEFPWCCPDHRNYTDQPLLSTIGQYPTIRPNPVDQDTGHIQLSGYCSQYENICPSLAHLCMCISTRTILKHVCLLVCVLEQSITQLSEGRFVMGHGYLPTRWRPDHPPGGANGGQRVRSQLSVGQIAWYCDGWSGRS